MAPILPRKKKLSIYERLKAETPLFWRKIGILGASFLGLGSALAIVIEKYQIAWFKTQWYEYMIVAGTIMLALAPLAVEKPHPKHNPADDEY